MVWIVGHRGSPTKEPENTFPSLEQAERDGANALEIDICVTADDELLVWHDCHPAAVDARLRRWNFEPYTKFRPRPFERPTRQMTLEEARASLGFMDTPAYLMTLGELFEWTQTHPKIGLLFIDVKLPASAAHLAPVVHRRMQQLPRPRCEIVLECAEVAVASAFRRLGVPHMLGLDVWKRRGLDYAHRLGVEWTCAQKPRHVQWPFPKTRLRSVVRHAQSKLVCAFNINDKEEMDSLLDLGVDGIMTDKPALLASLVEERAARSQPAFSFA